MSNPTETNATTTENVSTPQTATLDPPPTLYLSSKVPISTNAKTVVSLELTFTNYAQWKNLMIFFLRGQKVLGVVDGTLPCPTSDHPQYSTWVQCDDISLSWLTATLSTPVPETFLNHECNSSHEAWLLLQKLFLDHASATQMQLRHKFQHFKKGDLPMVDYLQQLHSIYCNHTDVGEYLFSNGSVLIYIFISEKLHQLNLNARGRGKFTKFRGSSHPSYRSHNSHPNYENSYQSRTSHNQGKNDSILDAAPVSSQPLKGSTQCQICNAFNHSALNCTNRFNHSFTSSNLHKSLAAMQFDEDVGSTWYPDSGASAHMTGNPMLLHSLTPYYGSTKVMVGNGD
ncbi:hypothetical protein LIER_17678 [Lithospermum erythrorhizon]|uniref:Retrotransposon Copia-like N-terminal domain-containing protein n=1 Tax=Lithospermum erythrorhizon TaxID=34254 RepID=A0AAV3QCX7_LITER